MKLEIYDELPPGGAELCCGHCGHSYVEDALESTLFTCSNCGHVLQEDFNFKDPPTEGVNFGYTRPNSWEIDNAKLLLSKEPYKLRWCIVEGSDGQFRLYKL